MITQPAIRHLIRWYARESGVRQLQKLLERVFRKASLSLVRQMDQPVASASVIESEPVQAKVTVTPETLSDYIGKQKYTSDRIYERTPPGVVMGLAYNSIGGSALYIECTVADRLQKLRPSKDAQVEDDEDVGASGGLFTTGQMGDVMKESTQIAYTVAKHFVDNLSLQNPGKVIGDFFRRNRLHMHVPEGATPKDGPSAGIAMTSSLVSLALGVPLRPDIAMTGEITLTGRVLPIGGVKEKLLAARRAGVYEVLLPSENRRDWDELDGAIRDGMTVHFVRQYDEVFRVIFGNANGQWDAAPFSRPKPENADQ